jgi:tetratricopeptide (TPR) repeat protein
MDRYTLNLPNGAFINVTENATAIDIDLVDKTRRIFDRVALRNGKLMFLEARTREDIDAVVTHLREFDSALPAQVREALQKLPSVSPHSKKWWQFWRTGRPSQDAASSNSALRKFTANSISRDRMALLWMEEGQLEGLSGAVSLGVGDIFVDDFLTGGTKRLTVTSEDVEWSKLVFKIAARADAAARQRDFPAAIEFYKEALALAPGADIYLMSIGCCYGNMGLPEKGIPYLRCAQRISPASERIRNNLRDFEAMLRTRQKGKVT